MDVSIRETEGGLYLTRLQTLLVERFGEEELRTLCFHLQIDYDSLPGQGKASKARELVAHLNRREKISELVRTARKQRPDVPWDEKLPRNEALPFTDREVILNRILYPQAPPYHLLDAPAGYGKTELLLELRREFRDQDWVCAYVSADEHPRLSGLVQALSKELELGRSLGDATASGLGSRLAGALKAERRPDIQKQGVVLLIDFGKMPSSKLIEDLLEAFIPSMQNVLRGLDFFRINHNRFRVVLAGRYLNTREEVPPKSIPLSILSLPPFSYRILLDTAREYLEGYAEDEVSQISAHIMHRTGGHPGCMASLLELFKEEGLLADSFFNVCDKVIQESIEYEVASVRESIPVQMREVMEALGVFRYLNPEILSQLLREGCIPAYAPGDAYTLADNLTQLYLMDWDGPLLRNDSMHRLLMLRLRRQESTCIHAQEICRSYMDAISSFGPESDPWIIEYLYQHLQRFAPVVQDPAERATLRKDFLQQVVPQIVEDVVDGLKAQGKDLRWHRDRLVRALDEDEEFRFTVNYFLRSDQYNDEPYARVRQEVEATFR